ncbi:MAG: helix-turn-helix transcriptional regulator [Acidobacteriota bacterium]
MSFGDEIRREREVRGIELSEIAESTKVNRRFLEALEANDFDALPGGLFTRGFIRAYATHIGADPDRLINAYLLQLRQTKETLGDAPHSGPRLEVHEPHRDPPARRRRRLWPVLLALAALAAALAVVLLPPGLLSGERTEAPRESPPVPAAVPERVLEILARAESRIQVSCSGEPRLDRVLAVSERAVVRCAGTLRLDASDGGDLLLTLDGRELGAPGSPGEVLLGWSPPAPAAAPDAAP